MSYWVRCASSVITITSSRSERTGWTSPCSVRNFWISVNTYRWSSPRSRRRWAALSARTRSSVSTPDQRNSLWACSSRSSRSVTITNDQLPGILRSTFWEKNSIESVFPDPCVCQNTPSFPRSSGGASRSSSHAGERVVDAEVLVVAGKQLDQSAWTVLEGDEVLDQVEHTLLRAHAPDHRLQRDDAFLALGVDLLPLREELPARRDRPHLRLSAIREDDEAVGSEDSRDRVAVVAEVVVVGVLEVLVRGLQLDEHERDAVDEPDEISTALVEVRVDPELGDEQEIVVLRMLPVDDGELLWERRPVRLADRHFDAVAEQCVYLGVGPRVVHGGPRLGDLVDRVVDRLARAYPG